MIFILNQLLDRLVQVLFLLFSISVEVKSIGVSVFHFFIFVLIMVFIAGLIMVIIQFVIRQEMAAGLTSAAPASSANSGSESRNSDSYFLGQICNDSHWCRLRAYPALSAARISSPRAPSHRMWFLIMMDG